MRPSHPTKPVDRTHPPNETKATYPLWPVEASAAALTVDARGVLAASDADSSPSALARGVQAERQVGHRLVEVALVGFAVAVAFFDKETHGIMRTQIVKNHWLIQSSDGVPGRSE